MVASTPEQQAQLSALLGRIATGDAGALAALYDQTSSILYGVLLRMLRDPLRAQEALQESYIRVWQRAARYDPARGEPIAWLIGVARYRALDLLRGERPVADSPAAAEDLVDLNPGPEDRAVQRESLDRLLRCLRGLSEVQRKSVLLAYYEGYSHTELSAALRAPLGTVKAWVRRGLAQLRECLER